jgi:hypothetical protein
MGSDKKFGKGFREATRGAVPLEICEVCGAELEIDPESGEVSCPVCENPEG